MKKLLLLLLLLPLFGSAQTTIFSETFETANSLTLVNGTQTNKWFRGTASSCAGTKALYIDNGTGATNLYTVTATSVVHAYFDVVIPAGATGVTLSFSRKVNGESGWDDLRVWSCVNTFVPTAGTVITAVAGTRVSLGILQGLTTCGTTSYTLTGVAGTTRRIIFTWRNDASVGNQPPALIDNITVIYGAPAYNPCATIPTITCGTSNNLTIASGTGVYNPVSTSCGFATPGMEYLYSFTPTTTGNYTISQPTSFGFVDWFYKVASGGCSGTGWTCIDDITNANGGNANVNIPLTAGTTYYIMGDPESTTGGNVVWTLNCPATPPVNDACSAATSLPCGTSSLAGTTVGTVSEVAPLGWSSNFGVWYTFTGDGLATTISSLAGAGFDHEMTIMTGVSCGSYALVSSQDVGFAGGTETYTFTSTLGTQYYIYIAYYATTGTSANSGTFTISRTCPPINDACSSAIAITSLPYTSPVASTVLATSDVPTSASTCAAQGMNIWYSVVGDNTNYSATTCNASTNFDTDVRVLTGACSALNSMTDVGCNDDDGVCASSTNRSTVSWCAEFGITYYISVGGWASTSGDVRLTVSSTGVACSVLPIELLSFDAYMVDSTVNIKWSTATETNCDYFLVERSIDGIDWKEIAHVNGNGTSAIVHHYKTTDPTASFGYNYYRLREVDYNGQFEIFPIKSVYKPDKIKEVYIYINTLGQQIDDLNNYSGLYLIMYNDGSIEKRVKN